MTEVLPYARIGRIPSPTVRHPAAPPDGISAQAVAGTEAAELGASGVRMVAELTGVADDTIRRGSAFDALIEPVTLGDPMSALRWTSTSTRKLTAELRA